MDILYNTAAKTCLILSFDIAEQLGYPFNRDCRKRDAGYFLPEVWGCPPALKIPQDWGIQGVD
jgi:hypothetical protein